MDSRIVLIVLTLIACASASSYFSYPGNFPVVYFADFKYVPTDYGYLLSYRTRLGVTHEEQGLVPNVPSSRNAGGGGDGDGDTGEDELGSARQGRNRSKLPFKSRKVSPKLLASLSG